MRKLVIIAAGVAVLGAPVYVWGDPPFGYQPDWESADERATTEIALADFNGDGWRNTTGERSTGDGKGHVFYLKHYPALTITAIRVAGNKVPRSDYCFDSRAGWFSLKNAPASGARVEVDYKWSNRLDFFAGNEERTQADSRDVIYFNRAGALEKSPSWLSTAREGTVTVMEADFDADGDVDVAIGGVEFIKIYKNTGAGLEKTPSWSYKPAGGHASCFAWGDVDNDDFLELAVADFSQDKFYVFKNNGGTLEGTPSWAVGFEEAAGVAWGDMDGDGDMDLACCTYRTIPTTEGYVRVFRNNNGVLAGTPCWRNAPPVGRCSALAWGDFNGDGWLDLVKGIYGYGYEYEDRYADIYYSNEGVLRIKPGWESELYSFCIQSRAADCDGDGKLDLVQATLSMVGYFTGRGQLEKYPSWKFSRTPHFYFSIRLGDINNDGWPDLVAGAAAASSEPTGQVNVLFFNKRDIGVNVKNFATSACERGVALRWEVNEPVAGFNLLREVKAAEAASEPGKVNEDLITGRSPYRYLDEDVSPSTTYRYWLEVVPLAGPAERHGPVACTVGAKASFALAQNMPNPARGATTIAFSVPTGCDAILTVYDIAGRKVATPFAGTAKAGANELAVDVSTLAPGVYTYRLEAGGVTAARKMVVTR